MYGYIYRTTLLKDGRTYIGQKKADHFVSYYYGSGVRLKDAINSLKKSFNDSWKEHIKVEIIEECNNQEELDNREIYWIAWEREHAKLEPLNLVDGGGTMAGFKPSEEYKENMRSILLEKHKNNPEFHNKVAEAVAAANRNPEKIEKQRQSLKARFTEVEYKERMYELIVAQNRNPEIIAKMKASRADRVSVYKGDVTKRVKKYDLEKYLADGWLRGESEYTKEKRRKSKEKYLGRLHIHKGDVGIRIDKEKLDEYLADGWELGLSDKHRVNMRNSIIKQDLSERNRKRYEKREEREKQSQIAKNLWQREDYREKISQIRKERANTPEFKEKRRQAMLDTVAINNGTNMKFVKKDVLDTYLADGWIKGRL